MEHTHYFEHKKVNRKVWGRIVADCKKLYQNMPRYHNGQRLILDGCFRFDSAQFNNNRIYFNGTDLRFTWQDHKDGKNPNMAGETFTLMRIPVPLFKGEVKNSNTGCYYMDCKTERLPYDLMVTACLLVYKHHSPETMALRSDGNVHDWRDAENFVKSVLGYEIKFGAVRYYKKY